MAVDRVSDNRGSAWRGAVIGSGAVLLAIALTAAIFALGGAFDAARQLALLMLAAPLPVLMIVGVVLYRRGRSRTVAGLAIGALCVVVAVVLLLAWMLSDLTLGM